MDSAFSIWSPVIIAELKEPRHYQDQIVHKIDRSYSSMEDLKIKIKHCEAQLHGKDVETTINLEMLFLVRNIVGNLELITRQDTIRDRVSLVEFNYSLHKHRQAKFIIDINDISWAGELAGRYLRATFFIQYALLAVKEQAVRLFAEEMSDEGLNDGLSDILHQLEEELSRVKEEKEELNRKLFFYERNINSLKRGVYKLENRNADLNRELSRYQEQVEQLQGKIYEKERQRLPMELPNRKYQQPYRPKRENKTSWIKPWGNRLKNMFMNMF